MPWLFILVFIMGSTVSSFAFAAPTSKVPARAEETWLRVRLKSGLSELALEGRDFAWAEEDASIRPVAIPRARKMSVTRVWNGRAWFWKVDGLRQDGLSLLRSGEKLALKVSRARFRGEALPEHVLLSAIAGNFDLIGVVKLEEYLVGVLAGEVPSSWPKETLKAQAVVARSYARAVKAERGRRDFHLESTIDDQVFRPVDTLPLAARARLEQAVDETRGKILIEPTGNVLKAYYHADCGGRTASASTVWGRGFDAGTAVDPSCPAAPASTWSLRLSKAGFTKALRALTGEAGIPDPSSLLLNRTQDERVDSVTLKLASGETREVAASELRRELGYGRMKSTRFVIREEDGEILISGRGFGHGVGFCQWGSREWARRGWSADKILQHYYPKATLKQEDTPEIRAWL